MTVEQVLSMIPDGTADSVNCNDYAMVMQACCEDCSPPPPSTSGNEVDTTTITIIAIVSAAVVCIAIVVAVVVLKKKQALPSPGIPLHDIDSSQSSPGPRGAKFDPNTGQPIPKFNPVTGVQNW